MIFIQFMPENSLAKFLFHVIIGATVGLAVCAKAHANEPGIDRSYGTDLAETYFASNPTVAQMDDLVPARLDSNDITMWIVPMNGEDLQQVLAEWANAANWQLRWQCVVPVEIEPGRVFEGDFVTAVHNMISTLATGSVFAIADVENRVVTILPIGGQ